MARALKWPNCLRVDAAARISVEDALASPYFAEVRDPKQEPTIAIADAVSFAFEDLPRLSRKAEKTRLRGRLRAQTRDLMSRHNRTRARAHAHAQRIHTGISRA